MQLGVGCPVLAREWILPAWFEHVRAACDHAGVEPTYVFVVAEHDVATLGAIATCAGGPVDLVFVDEPRSGDRREWKPERYLRMVYLRNRLLAQVRELDVDRFLSLDSDILLDHRAIANGLESLATYDAVALACHLAPGVVAMNYLVTRDGPRRRPHVRGGVWRVDVPMAAVLMNRAAQAVDYDYSQWGEDEGWARAAAKQGLRFGLDARVVSKHVRSPAELDRVDYRVGW